MMITICRRTTTCRPLGPREKSLKNLISQSWKSLPKSQMIICKILTLKILATKVPYFRVPLVSIRLVFIGAFFRKLRSQIIKCLRRTSSKKFWRILRMERSLFTRFLMTAEKNSSVTSFSNEKSDMAKQNSLK